MPDSIKSLLEISEITLEGMRNREGAESWEEVAGGIVKVKSKKVEG